MAVSVIRCVGRGMLAGIFMLGTAAHSMAQQPRFELLHLWGSDGETRALAAHSDAAKARGVDWTEHIVFFNFLGVRAMFAKRLALAVPPSGLFWIGGDSATQMIDAGLFRAIPAKSGDLDYSKALLPEVYDVVRYGDGDHITMLPVGSHIQNRIFYNRQILEEVGATPPKKWSEFLELAPRVAEAGYYAMIVTDQRWQNRYLFLAILAEKLNVDEMRRFLSGSDPVRNYEGALRSSMDILMELRKYSNPDIGDLSWDAAIGKVYHKNGLAYILGDFTGALIPKDDGSVICAAPPGNDYLMWAVDGIALTTTEDPDERAGQDILIETVGSPANHKKYLAVKGGVSAYIDGDNEGLDSCARASKRAWDETSEKIFVRSEEWTETLDTFATITSTLLRTPEITTDEAVSQIIEAIESSRRSKEMLARR